MGSWVISVPDELVRLSDDRASDNNRSSYTVCRVPTYIRKLKPDKYDCMMLPLGLYNRDFNGATPFDQLKVEVVSVVFKSLHLDANEWHTFCSEVAKPPATPPPPLAASDFSLEKFYHEPPSTDRELVQSVLTIDAIFIAAFYRYELLAEQIGYEDFQALKVGLAGILSRRNLVCWSGGFTHDLWSTFENQIPVFLIQNVLEKITKGSTNSNFDKLLRNLVYGHVDTLGLPYAESQRSISFNSCEHLLACVYSVVTNGNHRPTYTKGCVGPLSSMLHKLVGDRLSSLFPSQTDSTTYRRYRTLPSVSHLQKAGISVRGVKTSVCDIQFVRSRFNLKATLYLPRIDFEDGTQRYLLNMCVYEFLSPSCQRRELAAYLCVMDDLINTVEDVQLLRKGAEPVITTSYLGNDRDIADVMNHLLQHFTLDIERDFEHFLKVVNEIHDWNGAKWRHQLTRYFQLFETAPWIWVTFLAATVLLLSTILQTVYTIKGSG